MRPGVTIFLLSLTLYLYSCANSTPQKIVTTALTSVTQPEGRNSSTDSARIDFNAEIRPILQQRCQPCHFSGGVMYQKLPFDRPETIKTLGSRLFTRLKDEKELELIRQFLSQVIPSVPALRTSPA